jgi:phthiocerol/phenolphthiocerol synthesis type-I polyketide synthase E
VTNSSAARVLGSEDATTKQLTRIWQDLLGVESIGPDDNYFDLGGDSSLAVHMFAGVEKLFHVKLPLATLYDAPTIGELACILRSEAPATGWSPLVAIQPAGSRPPFFCFHGAGGNVLSYRQLSAHLGAAQPFYGLQCQGLDGSCPPLTRIEDMAALYVKEIRRVQRHGPYFLGGYCMGGTLAFEAAQQLRAAGESIALLALFDTMDWSKIRVTPWSMSYYNWQRLLFHGANFLELDSAGKLKFFREKTAVLRTRIPVWRGMLLAKLGSGSNSSQSESRLLGQIWQTNDRAVWDYRPQPYTGKVTDFRPARQYRIFNHPEAKWNRLAKGGQEIIVLPVCPAGMLLEPFVEHLADALRKSIDSAIGQRETISPKEMVARTS